MEKAEQSPPDLSRRDQAKLYVKGIHRSKFFRGQIDKYTWEDNGSSLSRAIQCRLSLAQLEE